MTPLQMHFLASGARNVDRSRLRLGVADHTDIVVVIIADGLYPASFVKPPSFTATFFRYYFLRRLYCNLTIKRRIT